MRTKALFLAAILLASSAGLSHAQKVRWKRKMPLKKPPLELFHSLHALNLPTAEFLQRGDLEFLVAHRFSPPISEGTDALFGLDGPAYNRLALSYGVSNSFLLTLGRSSLADNLDLLAKFRVLEVKKAALPLLVAVQAGVAWTTQPVGRKASDPKNVQYFALAIFNTMVGKKLGIGFAPAYLHNSHIYCPRTQHSVTLGSYVQFYASKSWSVLAEWNPTYTGFRNRYDSFALAIELETGGHFFKILAGNNTNLNLSQFLAGADRPIQSRNLRLGFLITRLLKF